MLIVLIITIVSVLTLVILHNAEKNLVFTVESVGQADSTGMNLSLLACNLSFIPINLEGMDADLSGRSGDYGSLSMPGGLIPPMSHETLHGRLDFTNFNAMKTVVNWVLEPQGNADFNATVLVKAKLFGVIPYEDEKNYGLSEFSNLMFWHGTPECQIKDAGQGVRQQLTLVQDRMSAASLLYLDKIMPENETSYTKRSDIVP